MAEPVLIVAAYDEDLTWVEDSPWKTDIVLKGVSMPNEGREASSYHHWIASEYDRIEGAETYGFVQGNPFAHGIALRNLREVRRFTPLGTYRVECDWDGLPHHPGLPLSRLWEKWRISDYKPDRLRFVSGANFLVPGWSILSRPRAWYTEMVREMCTEPEAPWCMERFWPYTWRTGQ